MDINKDLDILLTEVSNVAAALYQLVDYKELHLKSVPDDKTCTDLLQKWHVPGESSNTEAILFSDLTFEKADADKDLNKLRKRPIVAGKLKFCATPVLQEAVVVKKLKNFVTIYLHLVKVPLWLHC